jgi:hypothetical protein
VFKQTDRHRRRARSNTPPLALTEFSYSDTTENSSGTRWAVELAKKPYSAYTEQEKRFKEFAGRKHHADLESRPFEWYTDHLLRHCTPDEASQIWCKTQDALKHKHQRIIKTTGKPIFMSAKTKQEVRNRELDRRLQVHIAAANARALGSSSSAPTFPSSAGHSW